MGLNLGCGGRPMPGHTNVDRAPGLVVDVVWDLDQAPWPWPDDSQNAVWARDLFEHLADPVLFMTECWRVLRPGGRLWIRCPNVALNPHDAFTDPTHRRFPTWNTFDYWVAGTPYHDAHNAAYGGVTFERVDSRPDDGSMVVILGKPH